MRFDALPVGFQNWLILKNLVSFKNNKVLMRTLERTLLIVAFAGFLMRALLIPGGSEVLFIGFTFATLFYWLLSFAALNHIPLGGLFKKVSYANIGAGRILGGIVTGMALSTVVMGIQFRLLLFYGATEMIVIGGMTLFMILLIALIVMIIRKKATDPFYRGVFIRGGLAVLIGIIMVLVPTRSWISLFHRDDPTYRDIFIRSVENPKDREALEELENYRSNSIK
ncbi:MAG TPA: hypothetical protein VFE50_16505 [Cyclobacteriaceae bacterium]|nr:hypothetical protein [Cyclobacteriaceae bacterium]